MSNIFKRFRIESTIVEIDLSDTDIPKQIGDFLDRISRSTNVTCIDIEENQRVIVLLPITETLGALSFKDRVISEVEDTFGKTYARQIKCRIIPVAKDPLVTIEKIRGQKIE